MRTSMDATTTQPKTEQLGCDRKNSRWSATGKIALGKKLGRSGNKTSNKWHPEVRDVTWPSRLNPQDYSMVISTCFSSAVRQQHSDADFPEHCSSSLAQGVCKHERIVLLELQACWCPVDPLHIRITGMMSSTCRPGPTHPNNRPSTVGTELERRMRPGKRALTDFLF